jgi:hypothetical protein
MKLTTEIAEPAGVKGEKRNGRRLGKESGFPNIPLFQFSSFFSAVEKEKTWKSPKRFRNTS